MVLIGYARPGPGTARHHLLSQMKETEGPPSLKSTQRPATRTAIISLSAEFDSCLSSRTHPLAIEVVKEKRLKPPVSRIEILEAVGDKD